MTEAELSAIEARVNAATPGPWNVIEENDVGPNDEGYWAWLEVGPAKVDMPTGGPEKEKKQAESDAEFIAHARADVPALIAEVRRLQQPIRLVIAGQEWEIRPGSIAQRTR